MTDGSIRQLPTGMLEKMRMGSLEKLSQPKSLVEIGKLLGTKDIADVQNLRKTEAGQKALEMDAVDGKNDGKISANVWNDYAGAQGGKPVKNSIDVFSAMNSITAYTVRNQAAANLVEIDKNPEAEP